MKKVWGGSFDNSVLVPRWNGDTKRNVQKRNVISHLAFQICPHSLLVRAVLGAVVVILWLFGTVMMAYLPLNYDMGSLLCPYAAADIWHVPRDYPAIQAAINAAGSADEIVLDVGVYYESIDFLGKAITVRGTDPNDPGVVAATIIDGNQLDSGEWGDKNEYTKKECHLASRISNLSPFPSAVVFGSGEGKGSVLSGVTVQKVDAEISYGGVYCSGSSPTISKCIISENQDGGIYCFDSSATITNCTIIENGDGIGCWRSSLIITQCVISKNLRYGIYCGENSSSTLTDCSIRENLSTGLSFADSTAIVRDCTISGNNNASGANGGGICCLSNSSPTIANCLITGNSSGAGGGIACDWGCSPTISGCTIMGNSASMAGGGILCSGNASPIVANCIIARNLVSDGSGGGIYCDGAGFVLPYPPFLAIPKPIIMNCTITQNSASQSGGGICSIFSLPIITNCILWGDLPHEVSGKVKAITCSDIQTGYFGRGNIREDPLFIAPDAEDYHLQSGSPCINAGTSRCAPFINAGTLRGALSEDRDGHLRDKRPDMGVYEYTLPQGAPFSGIGVKLRFPSWIE